MTQDASRIVCQACGKSYAFKPEYAGKSVKCKCGQKIKVEVPPPAASSAADEFELAFAGVAYDVAPTAPPPLATPAPARPRANTGALNPLNYATPPKPVPVEKGHHFESQIKDLYVPLVLIVAGVILLFVDASMAGIHNPVIAFIYVIVSAVVNIILVSIAMFAAVRILGLGLGTLGSAALKLLAIALLPGAVGGIVGHVTMGYVNWGITLVCYYALLAYLFDLDASEMRLTAVIIWGLRFVSNIIIIAFASGALGIVPKGARPSRVPTAYGLPNSASPRPGAGTNYASMAYPKTDKMAAAMIADGLAFEAREWCSPEQDTHAGLVVPKSTMLVVAKSFYNAGAKNVWAANPKRHNGLDICTEFIVEMPDDAGGRGRVFDVKAAFEKQVKPDSDSGDHFVWIALGTYREL